MNVYENLMFLQGHFVLPDRAPSPRTLEPQRAQARPSAPAAQPRRASAQQPPVRPLGEMG